MSAEQSGPSGPELPPALPDPNFDLTGMQELIFRDDLSPGDRDRIARHIIAQAESREAMIEAARAAVQKQLHGEEHTSYDETI